MSPHFLPPFAQLLAVESDPDEHIAYGTSFAFPRHGVCACMFLPRAWYSSTSFELHGPVGVCFPAAFARRLEAAVSSMVDL